MLNEPQKKQIIDRLCTEFEPATVGRIRGMADFVLGLDALPEGDEIGYLLDILDMDSDGNEVKQKVARICIGVLVEDFSGIIDRF